MHAHADKKEHGDFWGPVDLTRAACGMRGAQRAGRNPGASLRPYRHPGATHRAHRAHRAGRAHGPDQAHRHLQLEARRGLFKTEVYETAVPGEHDPEVIRKRLESVLAIDPKDPPCSGTLYARLGFKGAMAKYRRAIDIDPAVAEAHFGLAMLYLKVKKVAHAQGPIEEAVRFSPWNPRYLETHRRDVLLTLSMRRPLQFFARITTELFRIAPRSAVPALGNLCNSFARTRRERRWHHLLA